MKKYTLGSFLVLAAGGLVVAGLAGCDTLTGGGNANISSAPEKKGPYQVYQASNPAAAYSGANAEFYIEGDPKKNVVATVKNGKVTFILAEISVENLQDAAGLPGVTGISEGLKAMSIKLLSKANNTTELVYKKIDSFSYIAVYYFSKDGGLKTTVSGDTSIMVKRGWNFMFGSESSTNPVFYYDNSSSGTFHWVL